MNKLNVYHCDIKDSNVLVQNDENGLNTRLIDWGLSIYQSSNRGIPRKLYRRPFQYNIPFSSILFNKEFISRYSNFVSLNPKPSYFQIREFVINYIFIWNDIRGPGHLEQINKIVKILTISELNGIKKKKIKNHVIEYDFTYYYIVEYISKILDKYTINGKIELLKYFNNIFLKNIDIWGFIMIYISLVEYLYNSYNTLDDYQIEIINKVKYIIIHFLYENPNEPINVDSLVNELTNLNEIIKNEGKNNDTSIINSKLFKEGGRTRKKKLNKHNKTRRRIMK
jgi:serine/threonine protein kinase